MSSLEDRQKIPVGDFGDEINLPSLEQRRRFDTISITEETRATAYEYDLKNVAFLVDMLHGNYLSRGVNGPVCGIRITRADKHVKAKYAIFQEDDFLQTI